MLAAGTCGLKRDRGAFPPPGSFPAVPRIPGFLNLLSQVGAYRATRPEPEYVSPRAWLPMCERWLTDTYGM
jgi:hypothetical protein